MISSPTVVGLHTQRSSAACRVTAQDAARWWGRHEAGAYDRVLVDAPCTSERHVLQQAAAAHRQSISGRDWSVRACQEAAALQVKLLTAACKVGACQAQQGCLCNFASYTNFEVTVW